VHAQPYGERVAEVVEVEVEVGHLEQAACSSGSSSSSVVETSSHVKGKVQYTLKKNMATWGTAPAAAAAAAAAAA
jgi:hypothetical protein